MFCFFKGIDLYAVILLTMVKKRHSMDIYDKILIYTCMNTNKAWSLNISAAAQWNSGHGNSWISTCVTFRQTKGKRRTVRLRLQVLDVTVSPEPQCFGVYSLIPLGAERREKLVNETLDRLEDISQLVFALKPKIHAVIFKLSTHGGMSRLPLLSCHVAFGFF